MIPQYHNTAKFIYRQWPVQTRSIRQTEERKDGLHQAPDPGAGERVRGPQLPDQTPAVRDSCSPGPHRETGIETSPPHSYTHTLTLTLTYTPLHPPPPQKRKMYLTTCQRKITVLARWSSISQMYPLWSTVNQIGIVQWVDKINLTVCSF